MPIRPSSQESPQPVPAPSRDTALYRVCWRGNASGRVRRSSPLPLYLAHFRARHEALGNPLSHYWVERDTELTGETRRPI